MLPGFIMMKENPSMIDECWQLRCEFCSQSFQLLAVEVCMDSLVRCKDLLIDYFLIIPLHWQNIFGMFRLMKYALQHQHLRCFILWYNIHLIIHYNLLQKWLLQESKKMQVLILSSHCFTVSWCYPLIKFGNEAKCTYPSSDCCSVFQEHFS